MRKYRWFILAITLMLMGSVFGQAQNDEATARAQALLEQGRESIGGSAKLQEVKSLSINGRVVRPGQATPEELKMHLMMEAGERVFFDMKVPHEGEAGLSERSDVNVIIRREHKEGEPVGQPGQPGMQKKIIIRKIDGPINVASGDPGQPNRVMLVPPFDMINLMTAWLLKPTPHSVMSYAGEAENGTYDVLEIKREHGPAARLFLDKLNHVPMMLTYRGAEPRAIFIDKNEATGKQEVEIHAGELQVVEGQEMDVVLRFSDHRSVDGVLLPHQISRTVNGQLQSEWYIDKYELNSKFEMLPRKQRQQ